MHPDLAPTPKVPRFRLEDSNEISEDEVWKRALKPISDTNPGWGFHQKPSLSHPLDRARIVSAVLILGKHAARPFAPEIMDILQSFGWPESAAFDLAEIATNAGAIQRDENLEGQWIWKQDIVDGWFEGD